MEIKFTVEIPDIEGLLKGQEAAIIAAGLPGMVEEMETIRSNSMEIVPVDSGDLRNSALVVGTHTAVGGEKATVAIGYGGIASAYAVIQHENPNFRHAEGKTWKYLEIPAMNAINGMGERLADSIKAVLGGIDASD